MRPIAHLNVLSPPLVLSKTQVDEMVSALRASIKEVMDDLVREEIWQG